MKNRLTLPFVMAIGLLVALLLASPILTTAADNLVVNGDLELGNTNGWEIASASLDSSVKYAGN